ncbi:unnamed protein product [Tenebrio molitor]|nr:unnamed protein product [Tenebrio molitor]
MQHRSRPFDYLILAGNEKKKFKKCRHSWNGVRKTPLLTSFVPRARPNCTRPHFGVKINRKN